MSAKNTPFSFHCMICYEAFHPEFRYPVVLPCGHTYVCNLCADRIDVCMECREPLYIMVPQNAGNPAPAHAVSAVDNSPLSWSSSARSRRGGTPERVSWSQPHRSGTWGKPEQMQRPMVKKRLPLPKNVVLLSLMEATELASEDLRKKFSSSPPNNAESEDEEVHLRTMNSMLDVEDTEEEKIKLGTDLAIGVSGTYAVAEREGMEIIRTRPTRVGGQHESHLATDEEIDKIVKFCHVDDKVEGEAEITRDEPATPGEAESTSGKLRYGDRVQIVAMEGGWAKLARGYGFVKADRKQLVKVGGPVDRACKLEAMLRSLSNRRKEFRMEQTRMDNHFIGIMNELQISLQTDEDLTVILGDTFSPPASPKSCKSDDEEKKLDSVAENRPLEERNDTNPSESNSFHTPVKRQTAIAESTPLSFGCFAGDVFSSNDDSQRSRRGPQLLDLPFRLSVDAQVLRERNCATPTQSSSNLYRAASHPSPNAMRAGAQAWRERNPQQHSPQGIDFRTGMSGHMALLSTHAHPHEYLEQPGPLQSTRTTGSSNSRSSSSVNLRMSAHTGLTVFKPSSFVRSFRQFLDVYPTERPPIERPGVEEGEEQTIQQLGSM